MKTVTDPKRIEEVLTRGVDTVFPDPNWLRDQLSSGRRLRLYTGWDPTTSDVHIGHTTWMWKLRQFQELGHEVIVLLGTFTAMIGDPTGKTATRKVLTRDDVLANTKDFFRKVERIFDVPNNPVTVRMNHEWLDALSFRDVIGLASHFTVQQMMHRDMFDQRVASDAPIALSEFLYPLMQGYDSVAMDVDLEVGGTDQTFNMLAGRTLMKKLKQKEKGVMTLHLLTDAAGRKIGKSEGNVIAIDGEPNDLFGKVMTLPDESIWRCFEMCTNLPLERIIELRADLEGDPRAAKAQLAWELVRIFRSAKDADVARDHFDRTFRDKELPQEMEEFRLKDGVTFVDVLVETGLCSSRADARRQVEQGGVKLDSELVSDALTSARPGVLQKGKRNFVRLIGG